MIPWPVTSCLAFRHFILWVTTVFNYIATLEHFNINDMLVGIFFYGTQDNLRKNRDYIALGDLDLLSLMSSRLLLLLPLLTDLERLLLLLYLEYEE